MIVQVNRFKDGVPVALETTYDAKLLDLNFVDWRYLDPITVSGEAERVLNTLTFRGQLDSRVEQICARCLEPVVKSISSPFELSYDVTHLESVDTTDDLRDILLLNYPERFLCREDCKGICPNCGANLNREACRCKA